MQSLFVRQVVGIISRRLTLTSACPVRSLATAGVTGARHSRSSGWTKTGLGAVFLGSSVATGMMAGTAVVACEQKPKENEVVTEYYTGLGFEKSRLAVNGTNEVLLGVSVRCMMGMCQFEPARAYAVGLYADADEKYSKELTLSGGSAAESHSRILNSKAQKTLVLKFDKSVRGEHVAKGFDRALIKRIRDIHDGNKQNEDKPHLKEFLRIFTLIKEMRRGTEIEFTWLPGSGRLHCTVRDRGIGGATGNRYVMIESENVARSVFDTYLGENSVFVKNSRMHFNSGTAAE